MKIYERKNCDCEICGDHIDRSASSETFLVITQRWYMTLDVKGNETRVPKIKLHICDNCRYKVMSKIHELKHDHEKQLIEINASVK